MSLLVLSSRRRRPSRGEPESELSPRRILSGWRGAQALMNLPTSSIVIDAERVSSPFRHVPTTYRTARDLGKGTFPFHMRGSNSATQQRSACSLIRTTPFISLRPPIFIDMFSIPLPESRGDYDEVRAFAVKVKYQYVDVAFKLAAARTCLEFLIYPLRSSALQFAWRRSTRNPFGTTPHVA
ncbi:hypothetical protein BC826DRAFT_1055883 [Russula brevipes]|nr:hypothetical protein BC826DRAFT_1055883 [Russula brevipes]